MARQDRSKQQHYVAQNYLRRWEGTDGKVWVFDKATGNVFPASVKNIGGEINFSGTQEVEKCLADADGKLKTVMDDVLVGLDNNAFTPEHKQALAPHVALQLMRTREARNIGAELGVELALKMAEMEGVPIDRSRFKYAMNPVHAQYRHLMALLDPDKRREMAQFFYKEFVWFVGVNENEMPLWTSDAADSAYAKVCETS